MKTFNAATSSGGNSWQNHLNDNRKWEDQQNCLKTISFFKCAEESSSAMNFSGIPIYIANERNGVVSFIAEIDGVFYFLSHENVRYLNTAFSDFTNKHQLIKKCKRDYYYSILGCRTENNTIILNADDMDGGVISENPIIAEMAEEGKRQFPLTSFRCLDEMFGEASLDSFLDGRLVVIDSTTADSTIKMTGKERQQLSDFDNNKRKFPPTPPERGYSHFLSGTGRMWHRAGNILIREKKNGGKYFFGQDGDNYFGVELASKKIKTVAEAFEDLIPQVVKELPKNVHVQRQGEWFILPVKKGIKNPISYPHTNEDGLITLPKKDKLSNDHYIKAEIACVVDGVVYAYRGNLMHNEHETIEFLNGWVTFVENTAVRSVSVDGVD
jgi:hypothetical protein